MTTDRVKALRRVLKVQDGLKRAADWRLAEAERTAADVEAARDELARFADTLPTGPLGVATIAQARRLALRHEAAGAAVAAEAEAMCDATARQKLLARTIDALAREEEAARERKALERLVEGFAARGAAGGAEG